MLRKALLMCLLGSVAHAVPTSRVPSVQSFEQYVVQFGKSYRPEEFAMRKAIFEARVAEINAHNSKTSSTHKKAINKFTDFTNEELHKLHGLDKNLAIRQRNKRAGADFFEAQFARLNKQNNKHVDLPSSLDWVAKGAVTPVKNQGGCGSCWAFGGTEAIESNVFLNTGKLMVLGPQIFVDCVENKDDCGGTGGCGGATPELLFEYASKHGAVLESDYPYIADDEACKHVSHFAANITGYKDVASNNYDALMQAIAQQPVAVGVAANNWAMYDSGVMAFNECDSDLNHVVLLVGYGTDPEHGDYWRIQNSWGPDWGEKGFIRLARSAQHDNTNCQKDTVPQDGYACKGGPSEISICGTCGLLYLPSYPVGGRLA